MIKAVLVLGIVLLILLAGCSPSDSLTSSAVLVGKPMKEFVEVNDSKNRSGERAENGITSYIK